MKQIQFKMENKEYKINILFTKEDFDYIKKQSKNHRLTIAGFCRHLILKNLNMIGDIEDERARASSNNLIK